MSRPRRLWDESRVLSADDRGRLEALLDIAARRLHSAVFVVVVAKLRGAPVGDMASEMFQARTKADGEASGANPVLLLLALSDRQSAVETGKGNAGIVPEIDAQQITAALTSGLSPRTLPRSLARAIADIVNSAEATSARRRPLPSDQDLTGPRLGASDSSDPASFDSDGATAVQSGDGGAGRRDGAASVDANSQSGNPADADQAGQSKGRSRLPIAVVIGSVLLLVLALRRRRQLTAVRKETPPTFPPRSDRPRR